jgi:hypothetical protein
MAGNQPVRAWLQASSCSEHAGPEVLPRTVASWARGEIRRSEFQKGPRQQLAATRTSEEAQRHRMGPPFA